MQNLGLPICGSVFSEILTFTFQLLWFPKGYIPPFLSFFDPCSTFFPWRTSSLLGQASLTLVNLL